MKQILSILFFLLLFCPAFMLAVDKVDINNASLQQLDALTGVGPVTAQKITDARPFSSIDDLLKVKGIGPATLQKIKDQGLAYVDGQAQQPTDQATNPFVAAPTPPQTPTPETTYPNGIFINEILPNPSGADETNEWVEIFNSNNFDIDLSGWQLQDTVGTITTFTINPSADSGQAKILANGFLVFKRPDTKIMFNNDNDGLNLLTPNKKIVDTINFISAPLGQSYNKTSSGWKWSATLTPEAVNIITGATTKTSSKALSNIKNSVNNNVDEAGLADISQTIDTNQENYKITNPWFLFFMALAITIISATIVLFIKLRFRNVTKT